MRTLLSPNETSALYDALHDWAKRVSKRHELPMHKRLAMVARHGIWLIGGEP